MGNLSLFISAHPDDALFFRGEALYDDAHQLDTTVVHVTITAGNAGLRDDWWQRREAGTLAALKATQSANSRAKVAMLEFQDHLVRRYMDPGFTAYFMRLPDGGPSGTGFPATRSASLSKLAANVQPRITAVDDSATYEGWNDLCQTIRAICAYERGRTSARGAWINASDPDPRLNPHDHADHYQVGQAVETFALEDGFSLAWWSSYDVGNRPPNIGGFQLAAKRILVEAYGQETGGPNQKEWSAWGAKSYFRTQTLGALGTDESIQRTFVTPPTP